MLPLDHDKPVGAQAASSHRSDESVAPHISSLVIHCMLDEAEAVVAYLRAVPDAEVSAAAPGKLVLVLETASEAEIVDRLNQVQLLPGVLAATLVFHHHEPAPAGGPE